MVFNSFDFLLFFFVVVLLYFLAAHRFRWMILLVASYYFYMNWNPVYALLMFFSTLVTYICSRLIEKHTQKRKTYLIISIVLNFSILFLFKYFNFLNHSIFLVLESFSIRWALPDLPFLLPVGISFYTFQAVGYTIDVYRKDIPAEKNFGIYALFISFFPQLVAGPIERASHLMPQFKEVKVFCPSLIGNGLKLMLWGYFIKVAIADRAAVYVDAVYNNPIEHVGSTFILATILFAIQIYCDFSGYSLIAVGCAMILGFDLMRNFRRPYFALTIGDFWRRWHISLSTWFKDYVYIPLGGSRRGVFRNYLNLFMTFLFSGIWHGANWTYVIWGAVHGVYQVIERSFRSDMSSLTLGSKVIRYLITMAVVLFGWIFFRANTVGEALYILKSFSKPLGNLFQDRTTFFYLLLTVPILILVEFVQEYYPAEIARWSNHSLLRYGFYFVLMTIIMLAGVFGGGQFLYFQF